MSFNIGKWIRGWRLDKFFKEFFSNKNNQELKDIAAKAVLLVEKMKEYVDNPTLDMITAIIPGDWDAAIVEKVKAFLPVVLAEIAKNSPCFDKPTLAEQVVCIIGNVKANPNDGERTTFWHNLVANIGVALGDGKFTLSDLFLLVEPLFRLLQKHKAEQNTGTVPASDSVSVGD